MNRNCGCAQCAGHWDKIALLGKHLTDSHGISNTRLEEYAAMFELPASLKGAWTTATRLTRDIFPVLLNAHEPHIREFAHKFFKVAEAINHSAELDSQIPQFTLQPDPANRLQRPGFLVGHPLHGLLWFGCDNRWNNSRYASFRAHLMMGYLQIRMQHNDRSSLLIDICRYGRMVGSSGKRPMNKEAGHD